MQVLRLPQVRWYDARARVALRMMAEWMRVPWAKMIIFESLLAEQAQVNSCQPSHPPPPPPPLLHFGRAKMVIFESLGAEQAQVDFPYMMRCANAAKVTARRSPKSMESPGVISSAFQANFCP